MSRRQGSGHEAAHRILDESRGIVLPAGGARMGEHVAACDRCRANVNVWNSFSAVSRRLRESEPPEDAVERAKALTRQWSRVTRRTTLNAALQYDSVWVPLAAGLRGTSPDQTVHQAEEFAIQLRVSRERAQVVVVGQVTNVRRPGHRLASVRVELGAGDRVVSRAVSNGRGEFHLEHRERNQMWVEVMPQEGRFIRIALGPKEMAS